MNVVHVTDLRDQRHPLLADYAGIREKQLAAEFQPQPRPGTPAAGSPAAPFGKFMAEGEVVFERLVGSPFRILSVLCTPARLERVSALLSRADAPAEPPPIFVVPTTALDSLIGFHLHRGLMAIGARNPPLRPEDVLREGGAGAYVILEDLTNHDNIGAVFRNAAAFGAKGIFLSPGCADPLYRKAIRVSVGHALRIPFARIEPWPGGLVALQERGVEIAALTPNPPAVPLREWHPEQGIFVCVLLGSEGPGLSDGALHAARCRVAIPMGPGVDSLNVGVTSALVLEHLRWVTGRRPCEETDGGGTP